LGLALGLWLIILAIIGTYHWYTAHIVKYLAGDNSALALELGIMIIFLWITGIAVAHRSRK